MTSGNGALRARRQGGGTPVLQDWGSNAEYGMLRDVLLGPVESFSWMETNAQFSSIVRDTQRKGVGFDKQLAMRQHREMVEAYEDAGVTVHALDVNHDTPYQVYTRDSSFMTPYGAVVCQLANPRRRGEYAEVLRFYLGNRHSDLRHGQRRQFRGRRLQHDRTGRRAGRLYRPALRGGRGPAGRRLVRGRGLGGQIRADRRLLRPYRPDGLHAGRKAGGGLPGNHRTGRRRLAEGEEDRDRAGELPRHHGAGLQRHVPGRRAGHLTGAQQGPERQAARPGLYRLRSRK